MWLTAVLSAVHCSLLKQKKMDHWQSQMLNILPVSVSYPEEIAWSASVLGNNN